MTPLVITVALALDVELVIALAEDLSEAWETWWMDGDAGLERWVTNRRQIVTLGPVSEARVQVGGT